MTKTAERNGVLFYIAPSVRQFQILGDSGIHEKCGPDFWKEVAAGMEESFRRGEFTDGIVRGVVTGGHGSARKHGQHRLVYVTKLAISDGHADQRRT